jgi:hypothetical protein
MNTMNIIPSHLTSHEYMIGSYVERSSSLLILPLYKSKTLLDSKITDIAATKFGEALKANLTFKIKMVCSAVYHTGAGIPS